MTAAYLEYNPQRVIRAELAPGEEVLWAGQPPTGLRLRAADAMLIPFSLLWGGFAVFWEVMVLKSKSPGIFALWGVPFVLIGLYLIFGRFFVDAFLRARTFYGVTSNRILIIRPAFPRRTVSLTIRNLPEISITERKSGAAVIYFGSIDPNYGRYANTGWPGMGRYAAPQFELAQGGRAVYNQVRSLQLQSTGSGR